MERKELYAKVKQYNLQKSIQEKYGKNFTQITNALLYKEVMNAEMAEKKAEEEKKAVKPVKKSKKAKTVEERFENLVKFLTLKHLILKSEAESILN